MLTRTWTALAAVVVVCLVPAIVSAEAGDGLQAGNLSVSPGVSASSAVDTNVFRQSTGEASPLLGSSLQLAPFINIVTLEPGTTDFALDGRVAWQQYLNFDNSNVAAQSGLTADAGGYVSFNKKGAVSFQIEDRLQRLNEPPSVAVLSRDGIAVMLRPGDPSTLADEDPDRRADAYIWVTDVVALTDELVGRGATLVAVPVDRPVGDGREVQVRDPDGNVLCFGQLLD